ncbi:MAG: hypothetical protein ABRQ39_10065 [Candidatus Eremiobacterota bacterium]
MRAYIERWKEVNTADTLEQSRASMELRWQQVNSIYLLASSMGITTREATEENEEIMRRWNKLKDLYEYRHMVKEQAEKGLKYEHRRKKQSGKDR